LLGSDKFKEIFGYSPDEKIHLVDPNISENFKEGMGASAVPPAGGAGRQIRKTVTGQVRLHFLSQTTVQNFLDSGI
jgi:hypothetical protein